MARIDGVKWRAKMVKWAPVIFGVFALLLIPGCTIFIVTRGDIIASNLSKNAGQPGMMRWLILWGILFAVYFEAIFAYILRRTHYSGKWIYPLLHGGSMLTLLTVMLPFRPAELPIVAKVHNVLAAGMGALTVLAVIALLIYLYLSKNRAYKKAISCYAVIFVASLACVLPTGMSGLTESLYTISVCILLFLITVWLGPVEPEAVQANSSGPSESPSEM